MADDHIRLVNMAFYGHHGVDAEERRLGQQFFVDLDLALDLRAAGRQDDLAATVDYARVYQVVAEVEQARSCRLIEALAEGIAEAVLAQFPVAAVTVRVRKPGAPLGGVLDHVEVEITRSRTEEA